jgi:hypothetical protein
MYAVREREPDHQPRLRLTVKHLSSPTTGGKWSWGYKYYSRVGTLEGYVCTFNK